MSIIKETGFPDLQFLKLSTEERIKLVTGLDSFLDKFPDVDHYNKTDFKFKLDCWAVQLIRDLPNRSWTALKRNRLVANILTHVERETIPF